MSEKDIKEAIISSIVTLFGSLQANSLLVRSFPECKEIQHKNDCIRTILEKVKDNSNLFIIKLESIISLHSNVLQRESKWLIKINKTLNMLELSFDLEKEQIIKSGSLKSEYLEKDERFIHIDKNFILDTFYNDLINEINSTYYNSCYIACIVLIRKICENLLIDLFRKKYKDYPDKQKLFWTGKNFVIFYNLIINLEKNLSDLEIDSKKINKDFIDFFNNKIRKTANESAHTIESRIEKKELDSIKGNVNYYLKLLFAVIRKL